MSGNWSVEMEFDRHTDPRFDGWRLCRGPANWFTFLCPDLIEVRQTQTVIELRMKEPFASTDPLKSTLEAVSDKQTKLRSTFSGTLRYPSNLLCSIVCAKVGDDMQRTLQQLKTAIEK